MQLPEPPELRRSAAAAAAASQTEGGSADCNVSLPPSFLPPHPLLSSPSAPRVITHFLLTHTFAAVMQWDPQCRHCLDYFFFFFSEPSSDLMQKHCSGLISWMLVQVLSGFFQHHGQRLINKNTAALQAAGTHTHTQRAMCHMQDVCTV